MGHPTNGPVYLYLTRRNLLTLLRKLDREREGDKNHKSLIKSDTKHPKFPIGGASHVIVTAVEDEDYYTDRAPGPTREFPHVVK